MAGQLFAWLAPSRGWPRLTPWEILAAAIGLLVLVAAYASMSVVKQDEAIVIFRLGRTSADMVRVPDSTSSFRPWTESYAFG